MWVGVGLNCKGVPQRNFEGKIMEFFCILNIVVVRGLCTYQNSELLTKEEILLCANLEINIFQKCKCLFNGVQCFLLFVVVVYFSDVFG